MSVRVEGEKTAKGAGRLRAVLTAGQRKSTGSYDDYYDTALDRTPRPLAPQGPIGYMLPMMPIVYERMSDWEYEMRMTSTMLGVLGADNRSMDDQLAAFRAEQTLRNAQGLMSTYEFEMRKSARVPGVLPSDFRPIDVQQLFFQREQRMRESGIMDMP